MDFVTHLPRTSQKQDTVWVIVDRLTKSAHFLVVQMTFTIEESRRIYIYIYMRDCPVTWSVSLYRIEPRSQVYGSLLEEFPESRMRTAFQPQTDGQSERTIQVLEDILLACVLDIKGSWEEHLTLVEFAYNNSCQVSI